MKVLVVVNDPKRWPFHVPGVSVIAAREYLTRARFAAGRGLKVINLCRSYRYQSLGYYVSLLAAARGHKPVPSVATIQDLKATEIVRIRSDELNALIQKSLASITSDEFTLSIYFGKNLAERHDRLSAHLFKLFHAPLMRGRFARHPVDGHWVLTSLSPISSDAIPDSHHEFVVEAASEYFRSRRWEMRKRKEAAYNLAILYDADAAEPPSDERAISKFMKAAQRHGMTPWIVKKEDYAELAEFDALFIRETTNVNHHTYRFARRADAERLVVIDDPESILRCTNKVYLAELLERHGVPIPKSVVVHRDNLRAVGRKLGYPCILKEPDSAFSLGVIKVENPAELAREAERLLAKSDLFIAQEFMPTDFDWRVGVLDGEPLYVCRYFMAPHHWQIYKNLQTGGRRGGRVECISVDDAPRGVVRAALKASRLIGDGFYGVDLKQRGRRVFVIEVNDNPSVEAGYEDQHLKDDLYGRIMGVFRARLDAQRSSGANA